jgi:hypothetical protein
MPRRRQSAGLSQREFDALWLELTRRKFRKGGRVPVALQLALSTRIGQPVKGGGVAEAWVRRQHIGKGCDKQWEIAAFYDGPVPCIGQAAVLAALNAAAAAVCMTHMADCPNNCPPAYTPMAKPGFYMCGATREIGALLQGTEIWNCECTEQVG